MDIKRINGFLISTLLQLNLSVESLHCKSAQEKRGTNCCDAILTSRAGGTKKIMDVMSCLLGGPPLTHHPPPTHPFRCPHPHKKGTNLLLFQIGIHLHTHQDLNLKCRRGMGQLLRYRRPCPNDSPGTGLHGSTLLSVSEFHYFMLAQSWKFGGFRV